MRLSHVFGIIVRYVFLMRRTWYRAFDLFYWTAIQIFLWGFITLWFKESIFVGEVNLVLVLLGALVFWELFYRAQQGVVIPFLEDVWARNLVNIFSSPISLREFIAGHLLLSLGKGFLSIALALVLAWALYALRIWELGFYFIPFFVNIFVFGWALGIATIGLIIRFGPSLEMLAWSIPTLLQPFSAVFYPVSILPLFLQKIALLLPTTYLFEGMRAVLLQGVFPWQHVMWATALNIVYFVLALLFFAWMFSRARKKGTLSRFVTD